MIKLFFNLFIFLIGLFFVLEAYIRINHLTIEVPQRIIDENGIQKYKPNQSGKWTKGKHEWIINEYGWPGSQPEHTDENLITLIGDSHIENFMNPIECHQATILKKFFPEKYFLQAGRSGASFIEYLEFTKSLKKEFDPELQIVYVKNSDFRESLRNYGAKSDLTQVDLYKKQLIKGQLKSPGLKKILYSIKTVYYFYIEFQKIIANKHKKEITANTNYPKTTPKTSKKDFLSKEEKQNYERLLEFVKENYHTKNILFVFHPETFPEIISMFKDVHFNVFLLRDPEGNWSWTKEDNAHWNCQGHNEAAEQVYYHLNTQF